MIPEHIFRAAGAQARVLGVSTEDWITEALVLGLEDASLAEEFYRRRALGKDSQTLTAILDKAPDVPPDFGDEL